MAPSKIFQRPPPPGLEPERARWFLCILIYRYMHSRASDEETSSQKAGPALFNQLVRKLARFLERVRPSS
eukprot:4494274-Pyramimonas_sp.AAC.1